MDEFSVSGDYKQYGQLGSYSGKLFLCEDSKVVGFVKDKGIAQQKYIFGKFTDGFLNFWKIQPLIASRYPIIYAMNNPAKQFEGEYSGYWGEFVDMKTYADMIGEYFPQLMHATVAKSNKEAMSLLEQISLETFSPFLPDVMFDSLRTLGPQLGNDASFTIKK